MADDDHSDYAVAQYRVRLQQIETILAGTLPDTDKRLAGYPPCGGSETDDRRLFAQNLLIKHAATLDHKSVGVLELAGVDGSVETLRATRAMLLELHDHKAARRFQLYGALCGDADCAWPLGAYLIGSARTWEFAVDQVTQLGLGMGLLKMRAHAKPVSIDSLLDDGLCELRLISPLVARLDMARRQSEKSTLAEAVAIEVADGADKHKDEDENEKETSGLLALARKQKESEGAGGDDDARSGLVVVPAFLPDDKRRSSAARDVSRMLEPIAGKRLPLKEITSPAHLQRTLAPRFPHLLPELDLILRQRLPWRILFLGAPGTGKTELARFLAEAADIPFLVYSAAGASDGSFGGTSAQWATARASVPLQVVSRYRVGNPLVVLDELDKAGADRRNGALVDVLLNYLEPSSARRVMDLGLELEVNLSQISYIATANRIDEVPTALRDRFRAIRFPSPGTEHLEVFIKTLSDDIALERGIDRRWVAALAQDEVDLIRQTWRGGSLRRLRRIIELVLDGREALISTA